MLTVNPLRFAGTLHFKTARWMQDKPGLMSFEAFQEVSDLKNAINQKKNREVVDTDASFYSKKQGIGVIDYGNDEAIGDRFANLLRQFGIRFRREV